MNKAVRDFDSYISDKIKNISISPPDILIPNEDEDRKSVLCAYRLNELGYPNDLFYDESYNKKCNKYYNVDEYNKVAKQIRNLMMDDKEVPQDLIDYMLRIKKIREDNNL